MRPLVEASNVTICAPGGRTLFDGLSVRLAREHVAVIGRNGVGKSTLLEVLAGVREADAGSVKTSSPPHFVPQVLHGPITKSHGQQRKQALLAARASGAEILLLDEPSEDLDEVTVAWLKGWLRAWPSCLLVASHDRRLLVDFRHFFIVSESGCRYFAGTLDELERELDTEHVAAQRRYVQNLNRLAAAEAHTEQVARRKARKKRYGRCSELDRCTARVRLNQKRSEAQVSHGRLAKLREARLDSLRQWSLSTRRGLPVNFSLELPVPVLSEPVERLLVLRGVSATVAGRLLFRSLDLSLCRERVAVVGPNGAGKTTLLQIMLGRRAPGAGSVFADASRIGAIEQGGANWMLEESLLAHLRQQATSATVDEIVKVIVAHKFPLALAERPLCSLSPGERARAALIALFQRSPAVELLILDEPTYSLDLVARRALTAALRAWPGALVVSSHDREFLGEVGVTDWIELSGEVRAA